MTGRPGRPGRPRPAVLAAVALLAAATLLATAALLAALPSPDECLTARQPAATSGVEESSLPPLGVRCRYTGPAGETVAVVDHRPPVPLVAAVPLLAAGTALAAVRWRRVRRASS